jgi:transglutaminase-like putative cysteine protease
MVDVSLRIVHETRYDYGVPMGYGLQRLRVRAPSGAAQIVEAWDVTITGGSQAARFTDQHGNESELYVLTPGASEFVVRIEGSVKPLIEDGVVGEHDGSAPLGLYLRPTPLTMPGQAVRALSESIGTELADIHALSARILEAMPFDTSVPANALAAEDVLQRGAGVCQDHSHVMIACARHLGLPARYVTGYLKLNDREEQGAGHAWAEVHIPGLGWTGFDVSNGYAPDTRYARLATGCDSREAAPVEGLIFGEPQTTLSVALRVEEAAAQQ